MKRIGEKSEAIPQLIEIIDHLNDNPTDRRSIPDGLG
jgi:thymidylate synthase